jgi:cytochrome c-type biogenesis protein CcmH/NrfG
MSKTRIILIVVTIALVWLMFLLPKVVVENESQLKEEAPAESNSAPAAHSEVPATVTEAIRVVRSQFTQGASNEKNAIFADSLRKLYTQAGQFDSAAWYAEQAATFFKTTESFLYAGNSYYEAYTFAMGQDKQQEMAVKAREYLEKVIASDPKNLDAKSKIALTYVSSSPMQGVTMLREVLTEDPKNEFALFNMGMLSIQSSQFARAVDYLQQLIDVNPNHVQGQLLLGVGYMNSGDKTKAKAQFEKVKQLDNDPAVQATADSYLKDLK